MEVGIFKKQYKGKDLGKIPKSKLLQTGWYAGIKYDGNYCQVHKQGSDVWMFTSTGQPFMVEELREELITIKSDFIIECEFNNNSDGKTLNDRTKSSTGTPRANFKKGIPCSMPNVSLRIFDIILLRSSEGLKLLDTECQFERRLRSLQQFPDKQRIKPVEFIYFYRLSDAKEFARKLILSGGEGAFAFHETHTIKDKGRSNLAAKLKADNNRDMICIGAKESDTVSGEWGALELQDEDSNIQYFGGLPDSIRRMYPNIPTKEIFNVKYESFTDGKYIQGFINGGN